MAPSPVAATVALALGATACEAFVAPQLRAQGSVTAEVSAAGQVSAPAQAGQAAPGLVGLATFGAAAALVAGGRRVQRTTQKPATIVKAFENETGVQPPVGFWDPAGFTSEGDAYEFRRRRVVELKHGRVSMLACMGYITPEYFKFPGYLAPSIGLKFSDVPNGIAALSKVPGVGWFQYVLFCGLCDLFLMHQDPNDEPGKLRTRLFGGDFSNYQYGELGRPGYLGGKPMADPEARKKKLNAELANGRLAMTAIMAMLFQNGTVGTTGPEMWLPSSAFESELGVQAPVGFWDPLGFTKTMDAASFRRKRQIELKHGRVCMIACMGYITPEYFKFEGYLSPSQSLKFSDVPNGLAAISKIPGSAIAQYITFCGLIELFFLVDDPARGPGDFANAGALGIPKAGPIADPASKAKKLSAEIANGRLAMMAIMGMFFQDGLTGSAWGDWALYTDSPLRAFENETGVQPPVGFWDPAGFTSEGDAYEFRRRRVVELKHGRVSMLACMGYITPEYFKFPGYLAPSIGLKFSDVPNGIAALSKVPGVGWFQYVLFCGLCDLFLMHQDPNDEPGKLRTRLFGGDFSNYQYGELGRPGYLGGKPMADPEARKKKLNAELANGRLAMTAIMAMLFQNGTVGTTGPEMWLPSSAFESELGVQAPVGFWDPLGFTKTMDAASFRRKRQIELKHGRVCMIACMGYITPEYFKFEGYLSPSQSLKFSDVPNGLAAISKIPGSAIAQYITFCGLIELFFLVDDPARGPGDFANAGALGIPKAGPIADPASKAKKLSAEIANGRLAMMAIMGMFFQDGLTGSAWGDWSLYTDSPLRAGVLDGTGGPRPDDFWDPVGLAKGKSDEQLLRWRAVELKNGRVAMLAVLGWFHVAAGYHPIGDAAARTRVSDDPMINATQLPMAGAWQVVFTIMCLEWVSTYVAPPPKDAPWDVIGWSRIIAKSDDDSWKMAQLREINNGRLAMMAIVGLVAQDMFTGDYVAGIAQPCLGNVVCSGTGAGWDFVNPWPTTPFVMPPLYPQ